jgi:hypothetical protein
MEWGEPIRRGYATDELQYESIARAAPGFPQTPVSAAASQRFAAHWVVGVVADATHLGVHTVYRVTAFACLAAIAFVVIRLVLASRLPEAAGVVALGLVITNPYAWRLLLIAPAMLSDGLLVLGVGVALLGLIEEEPWLAVVGCLIAVLGRETGLIPAIGVCVSLAVRRHRWAAVSALALPVALFAVVKTLGERFSLPDPSASAFTVVSPLLHLPGTARELADHFGRVVLASPSGLAILAAGLVALRLRGRLRAAGTPLMAGLLLAALVVLQPAAFNPAWVQHNESRLAALGIVPLALAAAAAFASTRAVASRAATALVVAGIALASLHHRYTWGGIVESGRTFVAVEAVVAVALFVLVLMAGASDSRQETAVTSDVDSLA